MKFFQSKKLICPLCGKETTVLLPYVKIGEKKLWGIPIDVKALLVCPDCKEKLDLEDKGQKVCPYCGTAHNVNEKCPTCGAP